MANVLLIEPDVILGNIYKSALETDHTIMWCRTAASAIRAIDEQLPDLIILELHLAMHNGVEFLYEFRSYGDWHDIPIIVLSHTSPSFKAISPMLWEHVHIAAYHYKPHTRLTDLIQSVDRTLAPS